MTKFFQWEIIKFQKFIPKGHPLMHILYAKHFKGISHVKLSMGRYDTDWHYIRRIHRTDAGYH